MSEPTAPQMHKVRTTMRPDVEIEVGDAELLDLQRQGLLATDALERPATSANKDVWVEFRVIESGGLLDAAELDRSYTKTQLQDDSNFASPEPTEVPAGQTGDPTDPPTGD